MIIIIPFKDNKDKSVLNALNAISEFIYKMDLQTIRVYRNSFLEGNDICIEIPHNTPEENINTVSTIMKMLEIKVKFDQ
jgi:hypothetical protein